MAVPDPPETDLELPPTSQPRPVTAEAPASTEQKPASSDRKHWVSHLEDRLDRLQDRLGRRGMLLVAALSMVWGLISGITLQRDYAHSTALVANLALLVFASGALNLWLVFSRRLTRQKSADDGDRWWDAQDRPGLWRSLANRPHLVTGLAGFAMQSAVQYVLMFALPLLFMAHAWIALAVSAAIVATSLVDPWWQRLMRHGWYMALVRTVCAVMAVSFSFAIWFPEQLRLFYQILGGTAVLAAQPWSALLHRRRPRLGEVLAVACVVLGVGAQVWTKTWLRVPLLSVWLRQPALGQGISDHDLQTRWSGVIPPPELARALSQDDGICCLTPVVAPSGVSAPMIHEWLIDGMVIDRIELPPIRGRGDRAGGAYRTYSCKHHLPLPPAKGELTCRAWLAGSIALGKAEVRWGVENDKTP